MCWSAKVSLNTYIVALFGTAFAIANGAPANIVAWLHLFSMMQLAEYFIWKNINKPYWNNVFSTFGLMILVLEPIASMFLMTPGIVRTSILLSYIGYLLLVVFLYYPWTPRTVIAKNGHLQWLWQNKNMPLLFNLLWVGFFLLPLFLSKHYIIGMVGLITVIITIITYNRDGTWGSMWCWIANISWLFIIGFIALNKCFGNTICTKKDEIVKRTSR